SSGWAPIMRTRLSCPSMRSSRSSVTIPPVDGGSSWAETDVTMEAIRTGASTKDSERRRTDPAERGRQEAIPVRQGGEGGGQTGGRADGRTVRWSEESAGCSDGQAVGFAY